MKRVLHIILLLLVAQSIHAQQPDSLLKRLRSINGDIRAFAVDNLDNMYLLNSFGQLKKINERGDSVAVFNDIKKYGEATYIDVSNPLRVLLYYRDFATIVVLDRLLNMRAAIDLRKQQIFQVKAVALSYDNKIWIYDEMDNKLKKIDEDGKLLMETADFRQLFAKAPVPQRIYDQDRLVYLYDSTQAIYAFDYYGAMKNKIAITGWQHLRIAGKYIYGAADGHFYRYNIQTFRYDDWLMPAAILKAKQVDFSGSRLYALHDNTIDVFELKP